MTKNQTQEEETIIVHDYQVKEIEQRLPKAPLMGSDAQVVFYQHFWFPPRNLKSILWFQKHFQPRHSDIIIASPPKCGTTWLKALLFATVNRFNHPITETPLLSHNPHDLVYRLENGVYTNKSFNYPTPSSIDKLQSPRLFNTHLPYTTLPESIDTSKCRILFICRNPLDTCVSQWHFYTKLLTNKYFGDFEFKPYNVEDYLEDCIEGKIPYGPFFEHVVEYWKLSMERPDKVLFLKYEDLKEDPTLQLKRVSEFVGMPFSKEEENGGVIKDIIELCSIDTLKDLDVNKKGVCHPNLEHKNFFRKGEVGDWTNYFSPSMVERMRNLMEQKLEGTGLTLKLLLHE